MQTHIFGKLILSQLYIKAKIKNIKWNFVKVILSQLILLLVQNVRLFYLYNMTYW